MDSDDDVVVRPSSSQRRKRVAKLDSDESEEETAQRRPPLGRQRRKVIQDDSDDDALIVLAANGSGGGGGSTAAPSKKFQKSRRKIVEKSDNESEEVLATPAAAAALSRPQRRKTPAFTARKRTVNDSDSSGPEGPPPPRNFWATRSSSAPGVSKFINEPSGKDADDGSSGEEDLAAFLAADDEIEYEDNGSDEEKENKRSERASKSKGKQRKKPQAPAVATSPPSTGRRSAAAGASGSKKKKTAAKSRHGSGSHYDSDDCGSSAASSSSSSSSSSSAEGGDDDDDDEGGGADDIALARSLDLEDACAADMYGGSMFVDNAGMMTQEEAFEVYIEYIARCVEDLPVATAEEDDEEEESGSDGGDGGGGRKSCGGDGGKESGDGGCTAGSSSDAKKGGGSGGRGSQTAGEGRGAAFRRDMALHPRSDANRRYTAAIRKVENRLTVLRESHTGTLARSQDTVTALQERPFFCDEAVVHPYHDKCYACHREQRILQLVTTWGPPYRGDPRRMWGSGHDWPDLMPARWNDHRWMAKEERSSTDSETHGVGITCMYKSRIWHALFHFKLHLARRVHLEMLSRPRPNKLLPGQSLVGSKFLRRDTDWVDFLCDAAEKAGLKSNLEYIEDARWVMANGGMTAGALERWIRGSGTWVRHGVQFDSDGNEEDEDEDDFAVMRAVDDF
ncbi:unnamed protein product [Phaeothamnion confervicola]